MLLCTVNIYRETYCIDGCDLPESYTRYIHIQVVTYFEGELPMLHHLDTNGPPEPGRAIHDFREVRQKACLVLQQFVLVLRRMINQSQTHTTVLQRDAWVAGDGGVSGLEL